MMAFVKHNLKLSLVLLVISLLIYNFFTRETTLEVKDKSNNHYVNDIYLSNDYIYNQLDDQDKQAYDYYFNIVKKAPISKKVTFSDLGCSEAEECYSLLLYIHDAISVEHPELINYATFSGSIQGDEIKLLFTNASPLKFASEIGLLRIERIIDSIKKKTANMTDGEKVLYVYEWIGDHATYDHLFTFASKNQSVFNVFINHNAVCAGFSKTATIIFQNIGIEAYSVTGHMNPNDSVGHMWNIIKINDKYYNFDSTWAASRNKKDAEDYYFGLIPLEMSDYQLDHPGWYPEVVNESIPGVLS